MLAFDIYKASQIYKNSDKAKKSNHSTKEMCENIKKNWLKIYKTKEIKLVTPIHMNFKNEKYNTYRMKEIKFVPPIQMDFKNEKYKWNEDYSKFILLSEEESFDKNEKENDNDNRAKDNSIYNYQLAAFTFATLFVGIGIYTFNRSF